MTLSHEDIGTLLIQCKDVSIREKQEFPYSRSRELRKKGWNTLIDSEKLEICTPQQFFGRVYYMYDLKTRIMYIHIIFRETQLSEKSNIATDVAISQYKIPPILSELAYPFIGKILYVHIPFLLRQYSIYKHIRIIYGGFSLGGFIASACASYFDPITTKIYSNVIVRVLTFDAPGTGHLNNNNLSMQNKIINIFRNCPNIVNTCGKHVGLMFHEKSQWSRELGTERLEYDVKLSNLSNQYIDNYRLFNEISDHNLDYMISFYDNFGEYDKIFEWPNSINELYYGPRPYEDNTLLASFKSWLINGRDKICISVWDATQVRNRDGISIGVIGFKHTRTGNVLSYKS